MPTPGALTRRGGFTIGLRGVRFRTAGLPMRGVSDAVRTGVKFRGVKVARVATGLEIAAGREMEAARPLLRASASVATAKAATRVVAARPAKILDIRSLRIWTVSQWFDRRRRRPVTRTYGPHPEHAVMASTSIAKLKRLSLYWRRSLLCDFAHDRAVTPLPERVFNDSVLL